MAFDISEDELPIYQAETEDHLTTLEDGLVRLEQDERDPELLQALFRAAHTIKGTAGMIGHKRLVEITHILENAFDAVRKGQLSISTQLIDICLETVDILRALRDEVVTNEMCACDVPHMVDVFRNYLETSVETGKQQEPESDKQCNKQPTAVKEINETKKPIATEKSNKPNKSKGSEIEIHIQADISSSSVASAARAFQVLMVLQAAGKILEMNPDQQTIESAAPVGHMSARILSEKDPELIKKQLVDIPEIDRLVFQDQVIQLVEQAKKEEEKVKAETIDFEVSKLGEYLLEKKLISAEDLKTVLEKQKSYPADSAPLLG
jgi:two-component system chemotaxis sensor kinase CheA